MLLVYRAGKLLGNHRIMEKICLTKGSLNMNKKIKTEAVDHLFEAVLTLKSPEECYAFFEDVCTVNELLSLSQRYEVAKMLREKKTYLDIAERTGTISRVNRSLNYGNDGYDMVFKRLGYPFEEK